MAERRTQIFSENVNSSGTQNDVVSMQHTIMETNAAAVSNEKFHRDVAPVVSNTVDSIEKASAATVTTATKTEMMMATTSSLSSLSSSVSSSTRTSMASTNDGIFVDDIEESIRKNNINGGGGGGGDFGGTCSSASSGIGLSMEENSICDITKNPHKYCNINDDVGGGDGDGGEDGAVNNILTTAGNLNPNMTASMLLNDDMDGGSICSSSGIGGGNNSIITVSGNGSCGGGGGGSGGNGGGGGISGGNGTAGSNGNIGGKNKGKRRRRKAKQKSNNIKPYKKSNWKFRPIRVRTERGVGGGESTGRTGSVRLLSTLVPYNTNKFLMEEHMPQLPTANGGGTGGRTRDSSFSIDESEDYYNALPEDEEEFLTKEFSSVYEDARAERLDGMSKNQLIREYLQMEANYDKLSKNLGERKCFDDSVKEQQLARTLEWEQIIGRLEERVKQLTDENLDLRRKMADNCNRGHRSHSPRKGKIITNHHQQQHHHNHHFHPYHHQNGNTNNSTGVGGGGGGGIGGGVNGLCGGGGTGIDDTNHQQIINDRMQESCSSSSSEDSDSDSTDTDSSSVGDSRSSDDSSAVDQDSHSSLSDYATNDVGGGGANVAITTTATQTIQNHHNHLNGVR